MSQTPSARRFFRTAVVVAIATTSIFGFVNTAAANSQTSSSAAKFEYVTVSAGQTLWDLAEQIAPNTDPQDWMQDVVNLNGLTSTDLKPGQRIAIP
jgi:LysM repeat protein